MAAEQEGYTPVVHRWLTQHGFTGHVADELLAALQAGEWAVVPAGQLEHLALSLKARQLQYEGVYRRLGQLLSRRGGLGRRARFELEDLQLELWNALGKTRDTLMVYGLGDVGEPADPVSR